MAVWTPALYTLGAGLVGLAVACGVTTILAHYSRSRGLALQSKLKDEIWGAMPSTICLRHSNDKIDHVTKQRYHQFLDQKILGWTAPSAQAEKSNPSAADQAYDTAVKWLLEYTRDTSEFSLLFEENISYGFRRNSLGLKPIGLAASAISLFVGIYLTIQTGDSYFIGENVPYLSAQIISLLLAIWWLTVVNVDWVTDAAFNYAITLLAACDR